jgi:hypothetical protein
LLVLQEFVEKREEEHLRMIAALIEASQFCDVPENRRELARMLAQRKYFDVNKRLLANALVGPFESGRGRRAVKDFVIYDALRAGAPTRSKGKWVFDLVRTLGGNGAVPALRSEIISRVFREDIFQKAARLCNAAQRPSAEASPFLSENSQAKAKPPPVIRVLPPMEATPELLGGLAASPTLQETSTILCA